MRLQVGVVGAVVVVRQQEERPVVIEGIAKHGAVAVEVLKVHEVQLRLAQKHARFDVELQVAEQAQAHLFVFQLHGQVIVIRSVCQFGASPAERHTLPVM